MKKILFFLFVVPLISRTMDNNENIEKIKNDLQDANLEIIANNSHEILNQLNKNQLKVNSDPILLSAFQAMLQGWKANLKWYEIGKKNLEPQKVETSKLSNDIKAAIAWANNQNHCSSLVLEKNLVEIEKRLTLY